MATAPANGSGAANPSSAASLSGVPAYQPRRTDKVVRISGQGRYATAAAASQSHWATASNASDPRQTAESIVLSRSDLFADALGGAALAAAKQAPMLMTHPDGLDVITRTEIQRILAPGKIVYLLGKPPATSLAVRTRSRRWATRRFGSAARAGTPRRSQSRTRSSGTELGARRHRHQLPGRAGGRCGGRCAEHSGSDQAGVGSLTRDTTLDPVTKNISTSCRSGRRSWSRLPGLHRHCVVRRVGPLRTNRYETAAGTGGCSSAVSAHAGIATGTNWPDALAGGALMATINGPMLLTRGASARLSPAACAYLDAHSGSVHTGLIFGAPSVVATGQQAGIGTWLSGPGGYTQAQNPTNIGINGMVRPASSRPVRRRSRPSAARPSRSGRPWRTCGSA